MTGRPDPATVLAHGPAARFVEEVLSVRPRRDEDDASIVCRGKIPGHSPAVLDGEAGAWATLELAAQAAALLQVATAGDGGEPVSGYLVRIRNARFERPTVPADTSLVARVARAGGAGALTLFRARVELDGEPIVSADLGTFAK